MQKVTGRMELKEKVVADTSVRGLIGVYSPIHRRKDQICYSYCEALGRSVPVLYLNLEGNSGDNYYFQNREGNDLGDLLYYMRQDNMNLGLKLVGMIRQKGGVDYIPAIRNEQDFRNVDREEWLRLFEAILEKSIYEILLLDLGDSINGLYQILENCGRIYTPYIDEGIAKAKLDQYEKSLRISGHGEILSRTVKKRIGRTKMQERYLPGKRGEAQKDE